MTMIMVAKTLSSSFLSSLFAGDLFKVTSTTAPGVSSSILTSYPGRLGLLPLSVLSSSGVYF